MVLIRNRNSIRSTITRYFIGRLRQEDNFLDQEKQSDFSVGHLRSGKDLERNQGLRASSWTFFVRRLRFGNDSEMIRK